MNNTIMFKEINEQISKIHECHEFNKERLVEIGNAIKEFNPYNILIVARGTSMHSGFYLKYLLEIYYKKQAEIAAPAVYTVYDSNVDLSKTLVIAISQSGGGKDIEKVALTANKMGALTLGITNNLDSIVAKACKYNLYCNVGKAVSYAATKTYTSTMYLVTKLVYELTHNEALNITEEKIVESLNKGLSNYDDIKELVKSFKDANATFTLGRGIPLSLTLEAALKMKETSHYHVSSYPASEFWHGPIVMANKDIPVIIFGLDKVTNPNIKETLETMQKLGVFTLLISNDKELTSLASKYIYINEENDIYALFGAIITVQLFACELSVLRGNNPDFVDVLEHLETY